MQESRQRGLHHPSQSGRVRGRDRSPLDGRRPLNSKQFVSMDGFVKPVQAPMFANIQNQAFAPKPVMQRADVVASRPRPKSKPVAKHPSLPRQARSAVLTRQVFHEGGIQRLVEPPISRAPSRRRNRGMSSLLVIMASMIFVAGSAVSIMSWRTNRAIDNQVKVLAAVAGAESDNEIPAEDEVTKEAIGSYQVAPDLPKFISIASLGVDARVKRMGVKANGELRAPSNIYDAGWYDGSAKPGDAGTVLIDGHVHGPTKPGVFYRLKNIKPGELIEIERGDGTKYTYRVVTSETADYDKVDMAKAMTSVEPGKPGLNLITCTGSYDVRTGEYMQRLIVYAVQVD